jgi:hypothetical protein
VSGKNKFLLDIGDLVEDTISGRTGIVLEIKKWSYSIDLRDVYVHWTNGEKFWVSSDDLTVISSTHGVYNHIRKDEEDFVVTISSSPEPPDGS